MAYAIWHMAYGIIWLHIMAYQCNCGKAGCCTCYCFSCAATEPSSDEDSGNPQRALQCTAVRKAAGSKLLHNPSSSCLLGRAGPEADGAMLATADAICVVLQTKTWKSEHNVDRRFFLFYIFFNCLHLSYNNPIVLLAPCAQTKMNAWLGVARSTIHEMHFLLHSSYMLRDIHTLRKHALSPQLVN